MQKQQEYFRVSIDKQSRRVTVHPLPSQFVLPYFEENNEDEKESFFIGVVPTNDEFEPPFAEYHLYDMRADFGFRKNKVHVAVEVHPYLSPLQKGAVNIACLSGGKKYGSNTMVCNVLTRNPQCIVKAISLIEDRMEDRPERMVFGKAREDWQINYFGLIANMVQLGITGT